MKREDARKLLARWFLGCEKVIESEAFAEFLENFNYSSKSQCATVARTYMTAVLSDDVKTALFLEVVSDPLHRHDAKVRKAATGRQHRVFERFVATERGIAPKWYTRAIENFSPADDEISSSAESLARKDELFNGRTVCDFMSFTEPERVQLLDDQARHDLITPTLVDVRDEAAPFKKLKIKFRDQEGFLSLLEKLREHYGCDISEIDESVRDIYIDDGSVRFR